LHDVNRKKDNTEKIICGEKDEAERKTAVLFHDRLKGNEARVNLDLGSVA